MEGVRLLTRTPDRFASRASVRLNMTMPAMTPPMTASPGVACFAASEATLMMLPPRCCIIDGRTAREQ